MKTEEKNSISPLALIAFGMVLLAIVTFALLRDSGEDIASPAPPAAVEITPPAPSPTPSSQEKKEEPAFRMPPYYEFVQSGTLEPVKDPSTVPGGAQAAYLVVQQNPEMIAQLPCFCYCDRFGHKSLHDCFVTDHAVNCDICLKEALQADQMRQQGLVPTEIREAIIAQFHPRDHDHDH